MSSTPTRKRLHNVSQDTSINMPLQLQNDEEERHQRRKSLAPSRKSLGQKAIDLEEARNHFDLCKKMFFENKITPKNAWNLRIIDYFTNIINTKTSEKAHLKEAASTLDICTKVFSCRVDDLHSDGVKLANTLAAQDNAALGQHNEESDEQDGSTTKRKRKKRSRLALNSKQHIAKDIETLFGPIPKISGVPFNIETNGDPERTINMFTKTIPFDNFYNDHLGDKLTPCFLTYNNIDAEKAAVCRDLVEKLVLNIKRMEICAPFQHFEVNRVDCELNNSLDLPNIEHSVNQNQSIFDREGRPIVTLDGSMHDIFADANGNDDGVLLENICMDGDDRDDVVYEENIVAANGIHKTFHQINVVSFCPSATEIDINKSVLSSFNCDRKDMSQWLNTMLVGPNHWKNKRLKRSAVRYSGAVEEMKVAKRRIVKNKADLPLDFSQNPPVIDFTAKVKPMNRSTTDEYKYIMPRNYLKRQRNSNLLMLMNHIPEKIYTAPTESQPVEDEFTHECQDYNYDNFNDSQYCTANANNDDLPEGTEHAPVINNTMLNGGENESLERNVEEIVGRNLNAMDPLNMSLEAVTNVFEIPPYAMKAKKINMKRIKASMAQIFESSGVLSKIVPIGSEKVKYQEFSSVYNELTKSLPESIATELSAPIAFFALLHLTNEHGVNLSVNSEFNDVRISNEDQIPPHLRK